MTVARFDLGACPQVSRRSARASRAALAMLASLPKRWNVDLPSLGTGAMTFLGLARDATTSGPALIALRDAQIGRITVDFGLAARLVDTALGGPGGFRSVRTLGPAERGVLAGVLGATLDRIGWAIGLGTAPATVDAVSLLFRLETPSASGILEIALPAWAAGEGDSDALAGQAGRLVVVARVAIAATRLPALAAAGLVPGDAIVFDGVRSDAFAPGDPWRVALVIGAGRGGYSLPVEIDSQGTMTVVGGFTARRQEETEMADADTAHTAVDATVVLSAAPIEVVAELGRATLRGDEIMGLGPGAVLTLGAGRGAVTLRVGGQVWAEGEIVDVEGELGVRVTRLCVDQTTPSER